MTNGEKIKQMFPDVKWWLNEDNEVFTYHIESNHKRRIAFDVDWWNAEYKEPSNTKTITISKGAVKHGNKDYVVYKRDWLMEHLDSEFEVLKGARKLKEKIAKAKPSTWLTDGLTDEEVKKALRGSCSMCEWEEEVNGEHCYECINDIKNNYTEKRDCENCKHRIPTVDIVKGKSIYGCECWECEFEQKEVKE